MAGTFSPNSRPKRPGSYFNFKVAQSEPIVENAIGIVGLVFTHGWGPSDQVVELNSSSDALAIYGRGTSDPTVFTQGFKSLTDVFRGEDLDNRSGAGKVLAYRATGASSAKSASTIGAKITLTAVYEGTYGNNISYTIVPDPIDTVNSSNLVIYVEGVETERFKYLSTDITSLAAQINGTTPYTSATDSNWVRASAVTSGTALTPNATQTALTGGNDGATLAAADYVQAMAAFEPLRFTLFAAAGLTDKTILVSLATWCKRLNSKGRRFMLVAGGAANEAITDAVADGGTVAGALTFNDPNIVRLGGGLYTDERWGDMSTADLTPRLAGIFAWRGEALSVTYARFRGLSIKAGLSDTAIEQGISAGVITIGRDSDPAAPVRLETAVTTYTTTTNPAIPVSVFGNPKFVRTMHGIEIELTEFAESKVIGLLPINAGTRDYVRGQMQARIQAREDAAVVQPGWSVNVSSQPAPSDDDNFVALDYSIRFGRTLEQVLNTVTVG